jgi:hypothetical protein
VRVAQPIRDCWAAAARLPGEAPQARGSPGRGDSDSGPPPGRWPGRSLGGGVTCGSLLPVVTAGVRWTPRPAGSACTQHVPAGSSRLAPCGTWVARRPDDEARTWRRLPDRPESEACPGDDCLAGKPRGGAAARLPLGYESFERRSEGTHLAPLQGYLPWSSPLPTGNYPALFLPVSAGLVSKP